MTDRFRSTAVVGALLASTLTFTDTGTVAAGPLAYTTTVTSDGRTLLADDPAGSGRIVEVFGDLESADHVAVFVPGAGWTAENFAEPGRAMSPREGAKGLLAEAAELDPDANVAAVAWLGYLPPSGVSIDALRSDRAVAGAPALVELTEMLPPQASVTWICHSYGSVVCGWAARETSVNDIALVGAAGLDVDRAEDLNTTARVWSALTADDGIRWLPDFRVAGFGHGAAPTSDGFGATAFDTGDAAGHSEYFEPGGRTLRNLAAIVLGQRSEVTSA